MISRIISWESLALGPNFTVRRRLSEVFLELESYPILHPFLTTFGSFFGNFLKKEFVAWIASLETRFTAKQGAL